MRSNRVRVASSTGAALVLAAGFWLGCGGAPSAGPGAAAPGPGTPDSDLASLEHDDTPSPSSPEFEQGVAAIREEKFELARERFEKVVAAQPRNAQAVFYLGVAQQNLGQLPAAQASYQKATELSPKLADAWVNWTATLLDSAKAEAALPVIDRGLAQNPKQPGLLY